MFRFEERRSFLVATNKKKKKKKKRYNAEMKRIKSLLISPLPKIKRSWAAEPARSHSLYSCGGRKTRAFI